MKTETPNISKVNELKFDIKWKEAIRDKVKTSTIRERFTGSPGDEFDIGYKTGDFYHIDGTLKIKHVYGLMKLTGKKQRLKDTYTKPSLKMNFSTTTHIWRTLIYCIT